MFLPKEIENICLILRRGFDRCQSDTERADYIQFIRLIQDRLEIPEAWIKELESDNKVKDIAH